MQNYNDSVAELYQCIRNGCVCKRWQRWHNGDGRDGTNEKKDSDSWTAFLSIGSFITHEGISLVPELRPSTTLAAGLACAVRVQWYVSPLLKGFFPFVFSQLHGHLVPPPTHLLQRENPGCDFRVNADKTSKHKLITVSICQQMANLTNKYQLSGTLVYLFG